MNVLEKILEEISEVEKEYVTGHKVLYALGATGMAIEISRIIHSHMDEVRDMHGKRLIDADLLIRKCEKWLKPKAPDEDEIVSLADIAVSMIMEIEEQPTVYVNDSWIPVEERLPEKRTSCLVTVKYNGFMGMYGAWIKTGHLESDNDWWGDCMGGEVIAWRPLPESYKPKKAIEDSGARS